MEERIVCEAGFFWRLVLARLERRVNALLAEGWSMANGGNVGWASCDGINEQGWLRKRYIVRLQRQAAKQPTSDPAAPKRTMHD